MLQVASCEAGIRYAGFCPHNEESKAWNKLIDAYLDLFILRFNCFAERCSKVP